MKDKAQPLDEAGDSRIATILVSAFVLWFLGNALRVGWAPPRAQFYVGMVFFVLGIGLFWYGCTLHARSAGYPWPLGLLSLTTPFAGLLGLAGPVLIFLLPDRNRPSAPKEKSEPLSDADLREWITVGAIILTIALAAALGSLLVGKPR